MRLRSSLAIVVVTFSFLASAPTHAQTVYTYDGVGGGLWNTATNWIPNTSVPGQNSGDSATIGNGSLVNYDRSGATTLADLTINSGNGLFITNTANAKALTITNVLDNDGQYWMFTHQGSNQTNSLTYTGASLADSAGSFVIDHNRNNPFNNDLNFNFAVGNTLNGNITVVNRSTTTNSSGNDVRLNFTGTGTFTNAGEISIFNSRTGVNTATATGTNTTYSQTGSASVTRVGSSNETLGAAVTFTMATVTIEDGLLVGNGTLFGTTGGVNIGNGDATAATLRVDPLTLSGSTSATASTTAVGSTGEISTLNIGSNVTGSDLTFNSDAVLELQIAPDTLTADRINVFGDLAIDGASLLTLDIFSTDVVLNLNDRFLLIDYTGAWNGTAFSGYANASSFTLGFNEFRIDYAGDFSTGMFTGGTDMFITVIPEPSTYAILSLGLGALWFLRHKRRV